jgi:hypothetical protein
LFFVKVEFVPVFALCVMGGGVFERLQYLAHV